MSYYIVADGVCDRGAGGGFFQGLSVTGVVIWVYLVAKELMPLIRRVAVFRAWTCGIGFVSYFLVFHRSAVAEIGFVSHILRRIQKSESRIPFGRAQDRQERDARLWRAFYLMVVWWARFVTPPVFGVAVSSITQRIIP